MLTAAAVRDVPRSWVTTLIGYVWCMLVTGVENDLGRVNLSHRMELTPKTKSCQIDF